MPWSQMIELLYRYHQITAAIYPKKHLGNRLKQWLVYLRLYYPEAALMFEAIRRERTAQAFETIFDKWRHQSSFSGV